MMEELDLGVPDITWHTSRDSIAELVAILGMIAGSLAKMGHEVVLLQKTEVAEVEELFGPGQVGSSTMPQKRNPARSEQLVALARVSRGLVGIAMEGIQNEHERDSGSLHAEWHFIPEACITSAGAINISIEVMSNLRVRPENMIRNLYVSQGLVMSEAVMLRVAPRDTTSHTPATSTSARRHRGPIIGAPSFALPSPHVDDRGALLDATDAPAPALLRRDLRA